MAGLFYLGEHMPQKDQSDRIGKSTSPVIERVIENNKNVQQPCPPGSATQEAYNKKPVDVGGLKK